jgi:hypothetical protein
MMLVIAFLVAALAAAADDLPGQSIEEVCTADHARLCHENTIQSEGAMRCLMERRQETSIPCRDALNARRQSVQDRVRSACASEIVAHCAREPADAPIGCLHRYEGHLSDHCRASLPRWIG